MWMRRVLFCFSYIVSALYVFVQRSGCSCSPKAVPTPSLMCWQCENKSWRAGWSIHCYYVDVVLCIWHILFTWCLKWKLILYRTKKKPAPCAYLKRPNGEMKYLTNVKGTFTRCLFDCLPFILYTVGKKKIHYIHLKLFLCTWSRLNYFCKICKRPPFLLYFT